MLLHWTLWLPLDILLALVTDHNEEEEDFLQDQTVIDNMTSTGLHNLTWHSTRPAAAVELSML